MKIRIHIVRYVLVAAAWLLLLIALPLPATRLNGFLRWRSEVNTWYYLRWMFGLPRQVITDLDHGLPFFWMDTAWMLIMLLGLILLLAAPIIVYRPRSPVTQIVIRCLAPAMLLLPATICLPESYSFPVPHAGLWLLAAAHILAFFALMLAERRPDPATAFPITLHPS
jgi:hypothetical protein